jgi:hypothetical protein
MRHTADSFVAELQFAEERAKSAFADDDEKEEFAKLRKNGPQWEPIRVDFASMIETAYQRHVHQPR